MIKHTSISIDYLSYTLHVPASLGREHITLDKIFNIQREVCPSVVDEIDPSAYDGSQDISRAPYNRGVRFPRLGLSVFWGGQSHCLFEWSGHGLAVLHKHGLENELTAAVHDRLTRIDLAVDFAGDATPDDLYACIGNNRIKSHTRMDTPTGTTLYVGSRKSERFARIYAYNAPHPRAGTTRFEMQLKKTFARDAASILLGFGIGEAVQRSLNYYKLEGVDKVENSAEVMNAPVMRKSASGTLRWLLTQCAPAFHKLVREGVISDPREFLETHFLDAVEGEDVTVQESLF